MARGPFAKIYRTLWDGTLGPRWPGWSLFVYMLANCDAQGVLDVTPEAISARSGMPLDEVLRGLEILEAPDPRSRTAQEEGRRIVRLDEHRDWGWRVVNYRSYRESDGAEDPRMVAARVKRWRERNTVTASNGAKRPVRQAEVEAEAEEPTSPPPPSSAGAGRRLGRASKAEHPNFAAWYAAYPVHKARREAARAYAAALTRGAEPAALLAAVGRYVRDCQATETRFKYPATWLNADCWLDETRTAGSSAPGGPAGPASGAAVRGAPSYTQEELRPPSEEEKARVRAMVSGVTGKLGGKT